MDNVTTVVGNVTREPELRFTPQGNAVATFGIAVNRRWKDRASQEDKESTSFFDVDCWGDLAEHVSGSMLKGTRAIVVGRLEQSTWETEEGQKRSKVKIVADEIGPSLRWTDVEIIKAEKTKNEAFEQEPF